jgi:hypothetical protein
MMSQPGEEEASMTEVSIVGVDLAKQSFQLHAAARDGSVVFRRKLSRSKFVEADEASALRRRDGSVRDRPPLGPGSGRARA